MIVNLNHQLFAMKIFHYKLNKIIIDYIIKSIDDKKYTDGIKPNEYPIAVMKSQAETIIRICMNGPPFKSRNKKKLIKRKEVKSRDKTEHNMKKNSRTPSIF